MIIHNGWLNGSFNCILIISSLWKSDNEKLRAITVGVIFISSRSQTQAASLASQHFITHCQRYAQETLGFMSVMLICSNPKWDWTWHFNTRYRKYSKNWDTWNNYHNCPTFGTVGFYSAVLCSKDADRIPNRVDPDQTAPWGAVWSGSAMFAQTYLSQYLKLLR